MVSIESKNEFAPFCFKVIPSSPRMNPEIDSFSLSPSLLHLLTFWHWWPHTEDNTLWWATLGFFSPHCSFFFSVTEQRKSLGLAHRVNVLISQREEGRKIEVWQTGLATERTWSALSISRQAHWLTRELVVTFWIIKIFSVPDTEGNLKIHVVQN